MIGTEYGKVEIIDYQTSWAEKFIEEKTVLHNALLDVVVKIEHIGSTSIEGMAAKPTIDIMVGLKELKSVDHYLTTLENLGYEFRSKHPIPNRLHFAKIEQLLRIFNLSLTKYESEFWENHILFRNYLKQHPISARAYQDLKNSLSIKFPDDTVQYTNGKKRYIENILQEARK